MCEKICDFCNTKHEIKSCEAFKLAIYALAYGRKLNKEQAIKNKVMKR